MKKNLWLSVGLVLLAGCGAPAPDLSLSTAREAAISRSQLAALAVSSPERLVENAPDEPGVAFGPSPDEDLGNQGQLEENLLRGARPTEAGIKALAAKGVKIIVDLENQKKPVQAEAAWAKKHGLRFVNIPLSVVTPPSQAKVEQFLAIAKDPANRPMYFHCRQGRDRTGCMAFAYRISLQGWTYRKAYEEMLSFHFHRYLMGLRYFLWRFARQYPSADAPALAPI